MRLERIAQSLFEQSSTAKHVLGDTYEWEGRIFRYSKAGEALSKGHILTPLATPTYTVDAVATNTAAEDSLYGRMAISQVVDVADAGATVAAGALAGMMLFVDDGLGEGQAEWIIGNTAGASGSSMKIYLAAALTTALTAAGVSDITIYTDQVVEKAAITSANQIIVGVAPIAVTKDYYFWRQIYGMCFVLHGGTTAAGLHIRPGDNTEGYS